MEIDIWSHLSDDTKQEIVEQEFRQYIRNQLTTEADLQRFLTNSAYYIMAQHCDIFLDEEMQTFIEEKVLKIIEGLSEYSVFRKPNAWDDGTNGMYNFLAQCLDEHKPRIKEIVAERVDKESLETIKGEMKYLVVEAVQNIYKEI